MVWMVLGVSSATTSIQSTACASILGTHGLCAAVLRLAPSAPMHTDFLESEDGYNRQTRPSL
ncbi:hypothetical protein N7522_005420 [Penicillium canescens]|nr:hypothetical protein N7522_005420 [Penicillium canescens]